VYLGVYEHATTVIERNFPDHHNSNSALRGKITFHYSTLQIFVLNFNYKICLIILEIAVVGTAGFLAEAMSATLYVPTDIISQRLRVQSEKKGGTHLNSLDIFKSIYRTDGIRGYYQGFLATLLAFTPLSVTQWAGYEATKKVLYNQFSARERKQIQDGHPDGFFAKYRLSQNNMLIVGYEIFDICNYIPLHVVKLK
jgi:hypothetical protein